MKRWQHPKEGIPTRQELQERDQALAYTKRVYNLSRGDLEACALLKRLAANFPGGLPVLVSQMAASANVMVDALLAEAGLPPKNDK